MNQEPVSTISLHLVRRYHLISKFAGILSILMGVTIIFGWMFKLKLSLLAPSLSPQVIDSAQSCILLGAALTLFYNIKARPASRHLITLFSLASILIAGLSIREVVFNSPPVWEQWLMQNQNVSPAATESSIKGLPAFSFLIIGFSILLIRFSNKKLIWGIQTVCSLVFFISLISFFQSLFQTHMNQGIAIYTDIPLFLSITLVLLSLGILLANPEEGYIRLLILDSTGGRLARRLLPTFILAPPLLGGLALLGNRLDWYNVEYLLVLLITVYSFVFTILIWDTLYFLHDSEKKYHHISGKLTEANLQNRKLLYSSRELEKISTHDTLTGLFNRGYFHNLLDHAVSRARLYSHSIAIMFLDLDHFKEVNDTYGHATGDKLLIEIGKRLRPVLREVDTLARIGGDELTIILEHPIDMTSIKAVVERIEKGLHEPFFINGHELDVTVSIGISCYPQDGQDVHTLLKNADIAMYHAKELGRNRHYFFDESLNKDA